MAVQTLPLTANVAKQPTIFDRRAIVRYLCNRGASCQPLSTYERLFAQVRDISDIGIGLVLPVPIESSTYMVIEMKTTSSGISLTMLARVIHSTLQVDGSWIVGCQFVSSPTEEQIRSLL